MKNSSKTIGLILSIILLISISSCAVIIEPAHTIVRHDNGKHKGWYKSKKSKHPKHYENHHENHGGHGENKGSKGKK